MSFVWRAGVTSTTPPGSSDTCLLVMRIVMTVVLGIGVLYGLLIMNTFQRYGKVMDKAWKLRIDEWIAEKIAGNYPALDDAPYPPPHWHPDPSARYQRPHSRYFQPFGGRHPRNTIYVPPSPRSTPSPKLYTYAPTYAPTTTVPLPGSPHSAPSSNSDDASTINRPRPNQPAPQPEPQVPQPLLSGITSTPNSGATPPILIPKGPVATAKGLPQFLGFLYPILESSTTTRRKDEDNALENGNSGGDEAPDDRNSSDEAPYDANRVCFPMLEKLTRDRVHFRMPPSIYDDNDIFFFESSS